MMRKTTIGFVIMAAMIAACSKDEEGEGHLDVEKAPFQKWDANTATVFEGTVPGNSEAVLKLEKIPGTEKEIDGRTTNEYLGGFVTAKSDELSTGSDNSGKVTAAVEPDGTIYITTLEGTGFIGTLTGLPALDIWPGEEIELAEPVVINMDEMTTGETRSATIELSALGQTIPVEVTYGPVEDDVTLMSKMGPIMGCRKFEVEGTFEMSGLPLSGTLINGAGYYHPTLGLVGWEAPDMGIGLSMSGSANYGDVTEGFNVIEMTDILTATNTLFSLHTYDRAEKWDADKDTHAKMLLEMRFADPDVATTHDAPDPLMASVTFGTMGGLYYFPHELVESPVSIFFPEENGNNFRYFYAFVDQAAKNQDKQGISYSISVDKDPTLPDLRVTARIGYTILPEGSY
ncbi:MAG: hypothetical protein JXR76_22880 [Deltaproteobacteria bacterium]|nr:hypothetical protein [Deltaproteobacteria bacterium]